MEEQLATQSIRKTLKLSVIGVLFAGVWLLLLYVTGQFLRGVEISDALLPASLLVGAIPLIALAGIAFSTRLYIAVAVLVSIISLTAFQLNFYSFISSVFLFLGLWRAVIRIKFELQNNVKFSASKIISRVGSVVVLCFMLAVSVQAYSLIADQIAVDEARFYQKVAGVVSQGILPIVERQLPGFHRTSSLDQYLIESMRQNPPSETSENVPQDLDQNRNAILERLGVSATGQEPLAEIARQAIAVKLRELTSPYKEYVPLVYTIGIFSLLRLSGFLISIVGSLWGLLLFWLLRVGKFFKITTTQILAEHVEI